MALVEVVRATHLDPFLVYYLANKRAQDALEQVPLATHAVMTKAITRFQAVVDRTMSENEREALFEQLDRIETRIDQHIRRPAVGARLRSLLACLRRSRTMALEPQALSAPPGYRDELAAQLRHIADATERNARPEVALAYGTHRRTACRSWQQRRPSRSHRGW